MKMTQPTTLLSILAIGIILTGCEREGPAEQAGENMDEAVEEIREKAEETGDKAMEQIEEATDRMEEAADSAAQ